MLYLSIVMKKRLDLAGSQSKQHDIYPILSQSKVTDKLLSIRHSFPPPISHLLGLTPRPPTLHWNMYTYSLCTFNECWLFSYWASLSVTIIITYSLTMAFGGGDWKTSINVNVKRYSSFHLWNCWCEKSSRVFYLNKVCFNLDWLAVNCLVREAKGSG